MPYTHVFPPFYFRYSIIFEDVFTFTHVVHFNSLFCRQMSSQNESCYFVFRLTQLTHLFIEFDANSVKGGGVGVEKVSFKVTIILCPEIYNVNNFVKDLTFPQASGNRCFLSRVPVAMRKKFVTKNQAITGQRESQSEERICRRNQSLERESCKRS